MVLCTRIHRRTALAWRVSLLLAALIPLPQGPLLAESILNFPRIDLDPQKLTGIAIVNPSTSAATVTLSLYQPDGELAKLNGKSNPLQISVGPESQYARVISEIFGTSETLAGGAWLQATSPSDDLTGFFLFLDPEVTFFDGADLPSLGRELIFDSVREGDGYSTEINVINPNPVVTSVMFQQFGNENSDSQTFEIPAFGGLRADLVDLFPEGSPAGASSQAVSIRATADQDIGGFYFVRGQGDLLGLNARPASDKLNTLYFPQMAVLSPFLTELVIANLSPKTEIVTLTAYQPDGTLFGEGDLQTNPVTRSLPPGGVFRESLETLFGFSGNSTVQGWLQAEATSSAIQGSLSYTITATGSVAAVASESRGRTAAVFSHIATQAGFFTGVALLNPGLQTVNYRIAALKPDGTVLGTFSSLLKPRERISQLIEELIPAAAHQAGGIIWVRSDIPIFLTSLFGNSTGVLANIPPQPVPSSFRPDRSQPSLRLEPGLAVLSPGNQQHFAVSGLSGTPVWSVNGVEGGDESFGTISAQGVFSAPLTSPARLPVTIDARLQSQQAGASVDVLTVESVAQNRGDIQSLAYVESLQSVFSAELSLQPSVLALRSTPQGEVSTTIFNVTEGAQTLTSFEGEQVSKMISYEAVDGRPYLLLAGRASGKIIRLDAQTAGTTTIASDLNSPTALVIDPLTGDLLVAEADHISTIPSVNLNFGLQPTSWIETLPERLGVDLGGVSPTGIAVDPCSGDIYISDPGQGAVLVLDRMTLDSLVVVDGLQNPGQLLALNRNGVSCPDSFHLLVLEEAADQVRLLVPSQGINTVWAQAEGVHDLAFLPPGSPLSNEGGVLLGEVRNNLGRVENVPVASLYEERTPNPETPQLPPQVDVTGAGNVMASTVFSGFPANLSVDGDRTTSWFSTGPNGEGQNFSTYLWTSAEKFLISRIAVLSNRDHPQFSLNFGFGSVKISVFDTFEGKLLYEKTVALPGTPDPDAIVFPDVIGNRVLLTFFQHESQDCGGFSELQVFARGEGIAAAAQQ